MTTAVCFGGPAFAGLASVALLLPTGVAGAQGDSGAAAMAATAAAQLTRALGTPGNERDPFMPCLLAMTLERLGQHEESKALYRKAYDLATGHNPPAAFVRPFAREKLGSARSP